jgi:hypothetical protein
MHCWEERTGTLAMAGTETPRALADIASTALAAHLPLADVHR